MRPGGVGVCRTVRPTIRRSAAFGANIGKELGTYNADGLRRLLGRLERAIDELEAQN